MKWFEGSIPAAIQLAKTQKSLFIVFISGDDEPSNETAKVWDDESVSNLSAASNCVALKLDTKSQLGTQFAQIYPVMVVPSVFFIAPETGLPLEVSMGQATTDQLLEKFNKALQMQQTVAPSSPSPTTSDASIPSTSAAASSDDTLGATGGNTTETVLAETSEEKEIDDSMEELLPGETIEERKERILRMMAERQELKQKEADEKEQKQEIERRKLGQETQKFRQWKTEMEKKEIENSYKKEKMEQKRAMDKVRADLELDRQERAVKYKQEKERQEEAAKRAKQAKLEAMPRRPIRDDSEIWESSRVQFRLPDGSTVTQVFAATETLAAARSFIQQRLGIKSVTLSTTYPKRMFVECDMLRTLLELDLVPSSVLVVLLEGSRGSGHMTASQATGTSFIWIILAPLIALWNFIVGFLFPPTPARPGNQNVERPENRQSGPTGAEQRNNGQQQSGAQGLRSRKVGNINRLTADDEDDESATWNGNSTQQM